MYQVPINSATTVGFGSIMGICLRRGMVLGTSLGTTYGLVFGLFYGIVVGAIIGFIAGLIGGFMLALALYAWRRWLSPHNISDYHLSWLAALILGFSYIGVWHRLISRDSLYDYLKTSIPNLLRMDENNVFAIWPSIIIAITIILSLPGILRQMRSIQ